MQAIRRGGGGGRFERSSSSNHLCVYSYNSLSFRNCRSLSLRMCLNNLASSANKYMSGLNSYCNTFIDNNPNLDYTGMVFGRLINEAREG